MARSFGTVSGTAIRPGVSANARLYTRENIALMVARAQARIDSGGMPLTMRVSHPADAVTAPVTETVGRVTRVWQETDGSARFEAALADTPEGRTVASLVDPTGGRPFVSGVSIRGAWVGGVRKVLHEGQQVDTAPDLELDGLDFTHRPGVTGAGVERYAPGDPSSPIEATLPDGRVLILESVQEARVEITEADTAQPASDTMHADPGYLPDRARRYPLDTVQQAKAAYVALQESETAGRYTSNQLKRARQRTVKALRRHGVTVQEGFMVQAAPVPAEVAESGNGSFRVELDNGTVCVAVSSWCIDPHDLGIVGRAAMNGACLALATLDPDNDGDMDVPGADAEDTDHDMGTAVAAESDPTPDTAAPTGATDPAPEPAADPNTEEEPAVSEPTTQAAADTTPAADAQKPGAVEELAERFDKFAAAVTGAIEKLAHHATTPAPAEPAASPAAPAESAPAAEPVVESEDDRIARLVEARLAEQRTALIQELTEKTGGPTRKGLVESTDADGTPATANEYGYPDGWPNKPLHQFTPEERKQYVNPALVGGVLGNRGTGNLAQ